MPSLILGDTTSSVELRTVLHAAMLADIPVKRVAFAQLAQVVPALSATTILPVGSVEYVREVMRALGVAEPANMSYPPVLQPFLQRRVWASTVAQANEHCFVKPMETKLFTGFVWNPRTGVAGLDAHDREQYEAMQQLPANTPVWLSEPVHFVSEWRYYIGESRVLGRGRYDPDGAADAPQPNQAIVQQMVDCLRAAQPEVTCALDVGVLDTGDTVLVECNDAWAIGLYEKALTPAAYLNYLNTRWQQLCRASVAN